MIEYARLSPGRGFSPARALLYYIQRLITPFWLRQAISNAIARAVSVRHPAPARGPGQGELRDRLEQTGFASLPGLVTPEWVDRIHAYLNGKDVVAKGRTMPLNQITPDIGVADYPLRTVMSCPAIAALINAPEVLGLAGAYLGCSPTLSSIGLRWSFPSKAEASDVQRFHRDPDDWRFVKLFIYLTDVDENSGPHVYVRGSHRTDVERRARSYDLDRICETYGAQAPMTVMGPRGTAFMADTAGIHMGKPPSDRPRLMLVAQYSLLPVFAFNYHPMPLRMSAPIDRYVNRLLIA